MGGFEISRDFCLICLTVFDVKKYSKSLWLSLALVLVALLFALMCKLVVPIAMDPVWAT